MKFSERLFRGLEKNWHNVALSAVCICLFLAMIAAGQAKTAEAFACSDWGLSFGVPGASPQGNVSAEELKQFNAYYMGNKDSKTIYLTFDAGYENGYTAQILDVLKKHEVPAAFFLVNHYLDTAPDLVKRMADEGHIVANHTASHPDMSEITDQNQLKEELEKVEARYKEITGQDMKKLYRPPQGKFSQTNLLQAKNLGYTTIFWSLAYADWNNAKQPNPQAALQKLNSRIHSGAIVLLHSTSKTNAEILDTLLTQWKEQEYTFGRLDDFLNQ
ncbi:MAG: polysaccharide deacetylase family protein [Clostridia bacterium]|nr:polysaccharide deacetylase family protein [Clostridia bacterium]MBQ5742736.1 polysaccharide deacetylase family protein [Clostridia bacterium]